MFTYFSFRYSPDPVNLEVLWKSLSLELNRRAQVHICKSIVSGECLIGLHEHTRILIHCNLRCGCYCIFLIGTQPQSQVKTPSEKADFFEIASQVLKITFEHIESLKRLFSSLLQRVFFEIFANNLMKETFKTQNTLKDSKGNVSSVPVSGVLQVLCVRCSQLSSWVYLHVAESISSPLASACHMSLCFCVADHGLENPNGGISPEGILCVACPPQLLQNQ